MQLLPDDQAIAVRWVLCILVPIPATMLAASLSGLPDRSFRRGLEASLLILLSWMLYALLESSLESSPRVPLFILTVDLFVRTSILEMTYRTSFKRALAAALLFLLVSSVLISLLSFLVVGVGVGYLVMLMLFGFPL
jgi:hypothetical protein